MASKNIKIIGLFLLTILFSLSAIEVENGIIRIKDEKGKAIFSINGLRLGDVRCAGGIFDGTTIHYNLTGKNIDKVAVSAIVKMKDNHVRIDFTAKPDGDWKMPHPMVTRIDHRKEATQTLYKLGRFVRPENGGVPYEEADVVLRSFQSEGFTIWEEVTGNTLWCDKHNQHLKLIKQENGEYIGGVEFLVTKSDVTAKEVAAILHNRPFYIEATTANAFNIFEKGEDAELKIQANGIALSANLQIFVRDFDGNLVFEKKEKQISLPFLQSYRIPISERGIYFAEASISDGKREEFVRTNLAILPPYKFQHTEQSIFGISAYFPIPSQSDVMNLFRRMGVRYLRRGDSRETEKDFGGIANAKTKLYVGHNNFKDEKERKQAIEKDLTLATERKNIAWEIGNEWNMAELNSGKHADVYVEEWLKPIAAAKKAGRYSLELLTMGLAGPDTAFLRAIAKNGGWDLIDGVAFHPGRGNVVPDSTRGFWSYLGAIRSMKKQIKKLGDKPLWVTECYACTKQHYYWFDSYRRAAENVILTYALGLAEGLKAQMFYQMHDSKWSDIGGVNQEDKEYHFGLLFRDGTIKPSLLAYCTISEHLDGAKFRKYLTFENPDIRGISFDTPRGQMNILWSRIEGDFQSERRKPLTSPEPWINHWTKISEFKLKQPCNLTITDCIGRTRKLEKAVSLNLDGAPLIIYGLDL